MPSSARGSPSARRGQGRPCRSRASRPFLTLALLTLLADGDLFLGRGTPDAQAELVPRLDGLRAELERALADHRWRYVLDRPTFDRAAVRPKSQLDLFAGATRPPEDPGLLKGSLL